jgi:ribosomal protein S12 methylthiotransferase
MPLQHISNPVLKAMRRQITKEETRELIETAREKVPGIAIRTTFLVGFPGETEADFQELLDFVEEMRFERVGVFQYSHEENTDAYALMDDIPAEIKEERANRLMDLQREISAELNQEKIGLEMRILIDRKESGHFIGRSEFDSPEVDNEVLIEAKGNTYLRIGDFANVRIIDSTEFDLFAEPIK